MGKMKKLFSLAFIMLAACFILTACTVQKDVGISSISINSESSVVEIYEGEFNEAEITATVVYEDDSTETITITDQMVSGKVVNGQQWFKVPGIYAVTVLFKGETVDLTVKVLPKFITVRFFDGDGSLITQQSIKKGSDATAPNDGFGIAGMEFIGWDRLLTNLTEDTDVYALYGNITTLDVETQFQDWQYLTRQDGSSGLIYEFYKFADGKVYYYEGDLESFLYSGKDNVQGVEYTAVYSSKLYDEVAGSWRISFSSSYSENHVVYYDNIKLYTSTSVANLTYLSQLNTKYALKNNVWYKWVVSEGDNETATINGYIKIGSNAKIEYYRGTAAPADSSNVSILSYTMAVNDVGNIVIVTEESSATQSLNIVCAENPYISNLDKLLTIVE